MAEILEQARYILDTIHVMQRSVMRAAAARKNTDDSCLGLTPAQMNTLSAIRKSGQVSIKELAQATEVSAPSASAMVDRLVELGAVTREPSKQDRREVVVRLTEAGEHSISEMEEFLLESIAVLLAKLGPVHARMWCDVYEKIREVILEDPSMAALSALEKD